MKNSINSTLAVICLLATALSAHAQDRPIAAPHGGAVTKAGNHHIEMVKSGDALEFYLLDAGMKTGPNKGITAKGEFTFVDGTTANMEMEAIGDDRFRVVLFTASEFSVLVTFIVNKEEVSGHFISGRRQPVLKEKPHAPADGHQH